MTLNSMRLDSWLWATRLYKTRSLASKQIKLGRVLLNAQRSKSASLVKIGDIILIKKGLFEQQVEVLNLIKQRSAASIAQTCYQETKESIEQRNQLKAHFAQSPKIKHDKVKPDKRKIRQSIEAKRHFN